MCRKPLVFVTLGVFVLAFPALIPIWSMKCFSAFIGLGICKWDGWCVCGMDGVMDDDWQLWCMFTVVEWLFLSVVVVAGVSSVLCYMLMACVLMMYGGILLCGWGGGGGGIGELWGGGVIYEWVLCDIWGVFVFWGAFDVTYVFGWLWVLWYVVWCCKLFGLVI